MIRFKTLTAKLIPLTILMLVLLLAACQTQPDESLVLPTPIQVTAEGTATTDPTPTIPAITVTIALTTIPSIATSAPADPTAVLPSPSPNANESAAGYAVAYVDLGDTLNVRSGPGADYPIVAELPPNAAGLRVDDTGQSLVAGSTWVWVEGASTSGYVNSRYLTESVSSTEFCGDPAVETILDDLQTAVANRDGVLLAQLVHPERGLRLRHNWWNDEILISGEDVAGLFSNPINYEWGTADGSGQPIGGTFSETILPLLDRDLLPAGERACDEIIHGPTAGMTILPEAYEAVPVISLYRAAGPSELEFDWGTWAVGIERWDGAYYLSFLVHYAYEI